MVFCNRIGRAVAVVGGLLLLAGPAGADLTFQVDIKERFNGQVVDDEATAVIVTKKAVEVSQRVYATSKITNGNGEASMTLEYDSTFVKDKANGEIDPPLQKVRGSMILVLDGMTDQFFVGTFKTGSLVP